MVCLVPAGYSGYHMSKAVLQRISMFVWASFNKGLLCVLRQQAGLGFHYMVGCECIRTAFRLWASWATGCVCIKAARKSWITRRFGCEQVQVIRSADQQRCPSELVSQHQRNGQQRNDGQSLILCNKQDFMGITHFTAFVLRLRHRHAGYQGFDGLLCKLRQRIHGSHFTYGLLCTIR